MEINTKDTVKIESRKRSIVKSILWRLIGIVFLACVTYFYTGSLAQTTMITLLHHGSFIIIYYLHERVWMNKFDDWKYKKYARIFTYEIILGNSVLGIISFVVTGSWTSVTQITLTYILNKLWMFYLYDRIWDRVNWGCVLKNTPVGK